MGEQGRETTSKESRILVPSLWDRIRKPLMIMLCIVFGCLYLYGSLERLHEVNHNMRMWDQNAIMWYARLMLESNYTFPGDANRMPFYPVLFSFCYNPKLTWDQYFVRGKYFNLLLSLPILLALFLIFLRYFSLCQAVALLGITTFTVYLFRSSYVHPDQLYYLLSFAAFLLMVGMFIRPTIGRASLCGLTAALAHLTKASMHGGFVLFLTFFSVKGLSMLVVRAPNGKLTLRWTRDAGYALACLGVATLVFFAVLYPHLRSNKKVFGRYFYNVNTTFYMWYDSKLEVRSKYSTREHGDRKGWPDLPPDQIPGPGKYWREHTITEMALRLGEGGILNLIVAVTSYGWFKYLLVLTFTALIGIATNLRLSLHMARAHLLLCLFVVCYFSMYAFAYCWNGVIGAEARYLLSLFLPMVFCAGIVINTVYDESNGLPVRGRRIPVSQVWGPLLLAAICIELYFILTCRLYGHA